MRTATATPSRSFVRGLIVGDAKALIVKPISAQDANRIIRAIHYSHKVVNNSQVHLGVFIGEQCGGAMSFGPSLDKRKMVGLVRGTLWHEFIELNRLAFGDWLPRNSESRAIGYAMRWLHKTYPHLKWVVSFADGTQCGDGTIYRASGFVLTGLKKNNQIWEAPEGETFSSQALRNVDHHTNEYARARQVFSRISLTDCRSKQQQQAKAVLSRTTTTTKGQHILETGASSMKQYADAGWKPKAGFQLRYMYFLDPSARQRLTVPILPFSEIQKRGAGMYRGIARGDLSEAPSRPSPVSGSIPTSPLHAL